MVGSTAGALPARWALGHGMSYGAGSTDLPNNDSSGAVSTLGSGSLPVLVEDPYSSCPVDVIRGPGLWLSPRGDPTAGES